MPQTSFTFHYAKRSPEIQLEIEDVQRKRSHELNGNYPEARGRQNPRHAASSSPGSSSWALFTVRPFEKAWIASTKAPELTASFPSLIESVMVARSFFARCSYPSAALARRFATTAASSSPHSTSAITPAPSEATPQCAAA